MTRVFRLVKVRYATTAFDGEGARVFGGRWSSPGTTVAYAAESLAVAMLETLVHVRDPAILSSYSLIEAEFPDSLIEHLGAGGLPPDWQQSPPPASTQEIGDRWAMEQRSAVLRVPSVVVPRGFNFLLNPVHPDFSRVVVGSPKSIAFDPRLLQP